MFVHSSRIQKQLEFLTSLGIDVQPIYKQADLSKEDISNLEKRFDFEQYKKVLEFALRQTKNPDYGLDFGNQTQLGGTIGMLSASCVNLKEAFIQGCKFLKLQGDFGELMFVDDISKPKLVYKLLDSWELDSPDTAKLEVDAMFSFLKLILQINSNNLLHVREINLRFKKPETIQKYRDVFGICPRFGMPENEMIFDSLAMSIPMKAFNPETFKVLNTYLQMQVEQLNHAESIVDKVKRALHASFTYNFPDINSVAEQLNLSSRTLQRKLSEEQTSFKEILLDAKFGIAKKLLQQNVLTISEISYTLGYSDLGNFSRSFKKHVGMSPQDFRSS